MTILFNRVGEATSTDNDSLNRKLEELSDEVARQCNAVTLLVQQLYFMISVLELMIDGFYSG